MKNLHNNQHVHFNILLNFCEEPLRDPWCPEPAVFRSKLLGKLTSRVKLPEKSVLWFLTERHLLATGGEFSGTGEEASSRHRTNQTKAGGRSETVPGLGEGPGEAEGNAGGEAEEVRNHLQTPLFVKCHSFTNTTINNLP